MSKKGSPSPPASVNQSDTEHAEFTCEHVYDCETWNDPEFIFAGPFIPVYRDEPGLFISTPYNTELSAFYRGTNAEKSIKKDLPRLIKKVANTVTKANAGGNNANYSSFMEDLSNDLVKNKEFEKFDDAYPDAKIWNEAIDSQPSKLPLMSRAGFAEAYVHTKIKEAMDFLPAANRNIDYHADAKKELIDNPFTEEAMYVAAHRFLEKVPPGGAVGPGPEELSPEDEKKRKEEFVSLLQFCLWANKNNKVLTEGRADAKALDPFQFTDLNKTKILVDESSKIYDGTVNKAKAMRKNIEEGANADPLKVTCSCHRLARINCMPVCEHKAPKQDENADPNAENPEPEKKDISEVPVCPTKILIPKMVIFDIICENAGMELFAVMCLAHFLVARNIVEKVRFHVKKIPWYETHATADDITKLIEFCKKSTFAKPVGPLPPPMPVDSGKKKKKGKKASLPLPPPPEPPPPPTSDKPPEQLLKILGQKWSEFFEEGRFIVANDFFWVSPYTCNQMKVKAPWLYRTLQLAGIGALFIGDVNYRRLLNDMRVLEGVPFESGLQVDTSKKKKPKKPKGKKGAPLEPPPPPPPGFNPAPIIAIRNMNCELLCGMSSGKKKKKKKGTQQVTVDPAWFETDDFGVMQYYAKPDTQKLIDKPCPYYGLECCGGAAQLVQVGLKKTANETTEEGDGTKTINVCTYPGKGDNLCD